MMSEGAAKSMLVHAMLNPGLASTTNILHPKKLNYLWLLKDWMLYSAQNKRADVLKCAAKGGIAVQTLKRRVPEGTGLSASPLP